MKSSMKRISKLYLWHAVLTLQELGGEWVDFPSLKTIGMEWGWLNDAALTGFVEIQHPSYEAHGNASKRVTGSEYQFRLHTADEALSAIQARIEKYKQLGYDHHPVYQYGYQHALDCLNAATILYQIDNAHSTDTSPFNDTPLFDKSGNALNIVQRSLFKEQS